MKVTNYGPDGLPITLAGWSTGITSLNSNVNTTDGGYSALHFVQGITANGSNFLMRPIVNFAAGSNTTITVDQGPLASFPSNTIRIHSTGGGSVSAGSNSTRVSEISTAGASTTLWSPFDHAHDGIGTITASSSNTMQRGTWNVRPGAGIALSLTDTDGDGEFDTTTISTTSGGGGGGLAQSFIGYNTIGGTWTATVSERHYLKKVTLAAATTFTSIDAYVRANADALSSLSAILLTDNAGVPDLLIAAGRIDTSRLLLSKSTTGLPHAGRWFSMAIGANVAAGDYWIGVTSFYANLDIANDASGSDVYFTATVDVVSGSHASFAKTTGSVKYSIRASVLS